MLSIPRLPRALEADPDFSVIQARLTAQTRTLWSGGQTRVPVLGLGSAGTDALGAAGRDGHLVLGLERIEKTLGAEAKGLTLVAHRSGETLDTRVSRLLLVSNDGAERLYRHVDRLVLTHAPRVLVAMLVADAPTVGRATTGHEAAVKVVLVQHKQAVATLLRALALSRDDR
jgi:hypothetical protein